MKTLQAHQYIFPLTDIMGDYVIGSLSDIEDQEALSLTVLPSNLAVDTGTIDSSYRLVYTDGTQKLLRRDTSMSSELCIFTKNLLYTDKLEYQRDLAQRLFDFLSVEHTVSQEEFNLIRKKMSDDNIFKLLELVTFMVGIKITFRIKYQHLTNSITSSWTLFHYLLVKQDF